jgi:hypothetical protein
LIQSLFLLTYWEKVLLVPYLKFRIGMERGFGLLRRLGGFLMVFVIGKFSLHSIIVPLLVKSPFGIGTVQGMEIADIIVYDT